MSETNTTTIKKESKPAVKRVYPVTDRDGKVRHVEATSPSAAVVHVYKPHVGRPLGGGEVNALHRAQTPIEVAGEGA
jgi:hypothetical protein